MVLLLISDDGKEAKQRVFLMKKNELLNAVRVLNAKGMQTDETV